MRICRRLRRLIMIPVMGSPEDVNLVVNYLRTKATGVSIAEARATIDKQSLDNRKITAYKSWDLISENDGRLQLTEFGRRLGRASDETRVELFGEIILKQRAYRIATEWIFHNGFESINITDLAAHLLAHIPEELGTTN